MRFLVSKKHCARRLLSTFLILLAAIFTCSPIQARETTCTVLTGNGINNWFPFSYRKSDNTLTGIVVDGLREALARNDIRLEIQPDKPWKRILHDLDIHQVDAVLGIYYNSERAKKHLYSHQIGEDEVRVFVKRGKEFPFQRKEDLRGRSGLRLLGGSLGDDFDTFATANLTFMEIGRSDDMIKMLHNSRADYGILGLVEGLTFIKEFGIQGQVIPLTQPVLSNAMHALINKNAACAPIINKINATIKTMGQDGSLKQVFRIHYDALSH